MLNPDGVIVGNYRCSLAGQDLNRNYRSKLKDSYPTVWHTKAMVKKLVHFLLIFGYSGVIHTSLPMYSVLYRSQVS